MAKDFTKKTFGKSLRGYASEEVDEYLAYVNDEYKKIEHRAQDFERKLILALKKIDELMSADEAEKEAAAGKRAEADGIYKKAQAEARAVVAEAETAAVNIREAAAAEAETRLNEAEAAAVVARAADNASVLETADPVFLCEGGKTYQNIDRAYPPMAATDVLVSKVLETLASKLGAVLR